MCGPESRPPWTASGTALLPGRGRVLLAELVHAPGGVHDLLLARVERVTARADLHLQVVSERGARLERVAAGAGDRDLFVRRMDIGFHGRLRACGGPSLHGAGRLGSKGRRVYPSIRAATSGAGGTARLKVRAGGGSADGLPRSRSPYPQKLWITLWVSIPPWVKFPGYIAYLLQWLKNDQPFLSCFFNDLQTHH